MNDEVCWFPQVGGCFKPATAIYKAGTRDISVCDNHQWVLHARPAFKRIELP